MNLPGVVNKNLDAIHRSLMNVLKVINGGIELSGIVPTGSDVPFPAGNLSAVYVIHHFTTVNSPETVPHNLGRVPTAYIVVRNNSGTLHVYDFNTNWNSSTIELYASDTGFVRLIIF